LLCRRDGSPWMRSASNSGFRVTRQVPGRRGAKLTSARRRFLGIDRCAKPAHANRFGEHCFRGRPQRWRSLRDAGRHGALARFVNVVVDPSASADDMVE
jgi:hypothetical protein